MNLDVTQLKPAQIGTSEIATKYDISQALIPYADPAALINAKTTTIDGGKITTGTVDAAQINTNAITSKNIIGGTINGTNISGVTITGAVIKASYIDLSAQSYLTNWQNVTNMSTIPTQYWGNFAQDELGNPIKDSLGYYRLVTTVPITVAATAQYDLAQNSSSALPFYTYDYYQVFAKKPVTSAFTIVPYANSGWSKLVIGKIWNQYNWSEYFGGKLSQTINIAGHEFKFEGYTEKHHYSDLSYNTCYMKIYKDGVLQGWLNTSGPANGSENGIPPGNQAGYYYEETFYFGDLPVRVRAIAFNGSCDAFYGTFYINGTGYYGDPDRYAVYGSRGSSAWHSPRYESFANDVGIAAGGLLTGAYTGLYYIVDILTSYPAVTKCIPKAGYSGPLMSYTHGTESHSWSYNNLVPHMYVQNDNFKIDQAI